MLVVVFGAAAAYGLWRLRPAALPWHPIGVEIISTPAFDIAVPENLRALRFLQNGEHHQFRGRALVEACAFDGEIPGEVYVFARTYAGLHSFAATRIVAVLDKGGEITTYREDGSVLVRRLDQVEADSFRTLLRDAGYPRMIPSAGEQDSGQVTLQSCLRGRYFGVVRWTPFANGEALPNELAGRLEAFAHEGALQVRR